ncbi:doublecortin domain-containing protein 2-like [Stegodyphus dumicola]|uniref:doublecortin domain-containing protein 2-like n=1 Tax=Stegodyphus dumicola TaxID=202533 RepID=UPI0015B05276|nr:doublecortin domain-containing protein 2-like [Stegodyphus dumicola]
MSSQNLKVKGKLVTRSSKSRISHLKNNDYVHQNGNMMNFPEAKWIQIFVNGDEHFSGYRCLVNTKYYRNFEMFLNYLTERLQPSFGAVRNIYTPVNGHSILSLDDLVPKQKYVVAGNERFKKLESGYIDFGGKKTKRTGVKPKNKSKVSKAKSLCHTTLSINLYLNGNFKMQANKVSFSVQDLETWDSVYKKISNDMNCNSVKRICLLNGKPVRSLEELTNSQSYVVICKHEVFKFGTYGNNPQKKPRSSSREKYRFHRKPQRASSVFTTRSSAQSLKLNSSLSSSRSNTHTPAVHSAVVRQENESPSNKNSIKDEYPCFTPVQKDIIQDQSFKENFMDKLSLDFDIDYSGVFRSKEKNDLTHGAVEVEDSPETLVDLPVDLLDAEEVEVM